jgi:hypothetical protein
VRDDRAHGAKDFAFSLPRSVRERSVRKAAGDGDDTCRSVPRRPAHTPPQLIPELHTFAWSRLRERWFERGRDSDRKRSANLSRLARHPLNGFTRGTRRLQSKSPWNTALRERGSYIRGYREPCPRIWPATSGHMARHIRGHGRLCPGTWRAMSGDMETISADMAGHVRGYGQPCHCI